MATPTVQGQNQKNTVAGATLVTKNARLIIQQADIPHINEIPNLPTHQAAAKVQANKWEKDIWPQIIKITADVIDFANTYQATYDQLKALVPRLQSGDKQAKDEFIRALEVVLIGDLQGKAKSAKIIAASIKQFHDKFQPLYQQFQTDFTQANQKLTQDNKAILNKQADLAVWKGKADNYEYAAIGLGVSLPITLTATLFVGPTVFAIPIAIAIGGLIIAAETAAMVVMLEHYAQATRQVNDLTSQINSLRTEVAQLTLIEHQISGLQRHTLQVVTTSAQVADGWVTLEQELNKTISHLKTISPTEIASVINTQLDAASMKWAVVLKQAKTLQPNGGKLAEKKFSSVQDMQNAIDQQAGKKIGA